MFLGGLVIRGETLEYTPVDNVILQVM